MMRTGALFKYSILLFFGCIARGMFAQTVQGPYKFNLFITADKCDKGSVELEILGLVGGDTVNTQWSTGQQDTSRVLGLGKGNYSLNVTIIHHYDTIINTNDTTLRVIYNQPLDFLIPEERCPVSISSYFSPNGDNYSDLLNIGNIHMYPNFEFIVYNKLGQRVHHQKGHPFIPWDGTWLNVNLPDGTYYYVFFFDAGKRNELVKGNITILR